MFKRIVSAAVGRLGYTIVPKWRINAYPGTQHLTRLFDLLAIDLVIDVGANIGQFRDSLREQCGFKGPIVSFEPVPHLARSLAERAGADPLWTVYNQALGRKSGSAEFNVMNDTQFSSFLAPRHDDVGLFTDFNVVRESVMVEITTLDAVLPELIARHTPDAIYVKMDTQGFDLEVLKGGAASLVNLAAFQIEASVRPIYDNAPEYREIIDYAIDRGFFISGFFSNNEGHFPQLIEFDCVMVHARHSPK